MDRIEIRSHPAQEVIAGVFCLGLLCFLLFYADGNWFDLRPSLRLFAWVCVACIAVGVPVRLALGVGRTPCIILDAEGIVDTRLKVGLIRWRDIRQPFIHTHNGAEFVCLELHDPKAYKERMPAWAKVNRALEATHGMPPFAINMNFLDMDAKTLLAHIHRGCASAYLPQA